MHSKIRFLTQTAMLFAVSSVLSLAESMLIPPSLLPVGVKPGLANIPVMLAVTMLSKRAGVCITVLKSLLAFCTRGASAGFLSLCGGLLSVGVVCALLLLHRERVSCVLLGCLGSTAHGFGQLCGASLLLSSPLVFGYFPILNVCCLVSGVFTGILFYVLQSFWTSSFNSLEEKNELVCPKGKNPSPSGK